MDRKNTKLVNMVYKTLNPEERVLLLQKLWRDGYGKQLTEPLEFSVGEEVWVKALVVQADPNDPRELTYAVTLDDEHTQGSLVSDPFWLPASSLKALDE